MLFNDNRQQMRQFFFQCWQKYKTEQVLEPLERQLVNVILDHPEYHALLEQPEKNQERDYFPELGESNPFLHLALHLSLVEQLTTDRPTGIRTIYQQLLAKYNDRLEVEHSMINCIADNIWRAQKYGTLVDDATYLSQLSALVEQR